MDPQKTRARAQVGLFFLILSEIRVPRTRVLTPRKYVFRTRATLFQWKSSIFNDHRYIRKHWPKTRIIFRADGGLCRDNILRWCERNKIHYIVGYSRNSRLEKASKDLVARAALDYEKTGEKQTLYDQIYY